MIFVREKEEVEVNDSNLFSVYEREGYLPKKTLKTAPIEDDTELEDKSIEEVKAAKVKKKKE